VLTVQHAADCPPALFARWLDEAGCNLDVRHPYAGDPLPDAAGLAPYAGLLVLGGPMGADDDARHAWLAPLKELLRTTSLPALGICLGHQLMASALGGRVDRNPHGQQVGLLDVGWTPAATADPLLGPLATPRRGVQWNDDVVVELPPGAELLAATPGGEVQAVRYGPLMWGVQLHPEVDAEVLVPWAESDRGSHETRGIDTDGVLRAVERARAELDEAWRPLAVGFAGIVAGAVADR
jgi:GMP synthase (glutamine-hydrolysing)